MSRRFAGAAAALRAGAWISIAFLALGLIDSVFAPDPIAPVRPSELREAAAGLLRLQTGSLLHLGLLALLVTPIVRLIAVAVEVVRARDTTFALLTLGVLLLLTSSIWIGMH